MESKEVCMYVCSYIAKQGRMPMRFILWLPILAQYQPLHDAREEDDGTIKGAAEVTKLTQDEENLKTHMEGVATLQPEQK